MTPGDEGGGAGGTRAVPSSLRLTTQRALRAAALRLAEAKQGQATAIAAAHRSGAAIPEIARVTGLDAFDVRDVLVREGVLAPLKPKEGVARDAAF
ncbi:MAG: hypothetical protein JWO90_2812 [Solirubrobacterales bacterium]|jgi:hypothetical protein|nr:hypothetical protein [Solirubrobacterales bacterium]